MVLILSRSDLEHVLNIREVIDVLEQAFKEYAMGKTIAPTRLSLLVQKYEGWLGIMPAYIEELGALSTKLVTVYGKNPTMNKNLPTTMASIILNDPETGQALSFMDGGLITAMRTGALGGLAAKILSRKDARTVGIFGAGIQARTQILALEEVRDITLVRVFDPFTDRAKKFAREMNERTGIEFQVCDSSSDAVKESDIVVTVSTSKEPVFDGGLLREGTHINAFGNFKPTERELDDECVRRSKVFVDQREAALDEAGDLIIPIESGVITREHVLAELGELVIGSKNGRIHGSDITLFKSVGLGIQDCATASLAYRRALETGRGTQ